MLESHTARNNTQTGTHAHVQYYSNHASRQHFYFVLGQRVWATTLLTHHHFPLPGSSQLARDPQGLTFGDSRSTGTTVFFKPYALPDTQLSVWM